MPHRAGLDASATLHHISVGGIEKHRIVKVISDLKILYSENISIERLRADSWNRQLNGARARIADRTGKEIKWLL